MRKGATATNNRKRARAVLSTAADIFLPASVVVFAGRKAAEKGVEKATAHIVGLDASMPALGCNKLQLTSL